MRYKLETIGLGKRYGESVALAPTDLQVRAGEFLTLLGPSGSGKTTLLQMISGLTLPSSGTLLLDGVDATQMPPGKRGIGMVFQNYALFPHMTVWENVAYGLRMRRAPADALKRRSRGADDGQDGRVRAPLPARAVRRAAAAHRAGALLCLSPVGDPAGRAAGRAGQAARTHAARNPPPACGIAGHLHLRHARPGRSPGHVRPHLPDEPGPH